MFPEIKFCEGRRSLLAGAAALAASASIPRVYAAARAAGETWSPSKALLSDLPRLMQALAVPGLTFAVVESGRITSTHVAGVLRAGTPGAVDAGTLFEAASLSKPMFAYLVLQLVDRGVLELDRPLVRYRRPDYLGDDPRLDRITARDVLRHSTGLVNWRQAPATEKLVTQAEPGTRVDYSGEAIFWLQLILERLTGKSLDVLMRSHLFGPASMRDSSYTWDASSAARSVYGHAGPDGEPAQPRQWFRDVWSAAQPIADAIGKPLAEWTYEDAQRALPKVTAQLPPGTISWAGDLDANAAASLRTTATDYARFLALCLPHPQRADFELREATRQAMLTPQLPLRGRWSQKTLGWNLENTPTGPVFFHSGSNGGIFKTFALGDPLRRRGMVVFTNGGGGHFLYRRLVRDVAGLDLLAFDI